MFSQDEGGWTRKPASLQRLAGTGVRNGIPGAVVNASDVDAEPEWKESYGGFHGPGSKAQNRSFLSWKITWQWMIYGGTPILGSLQILTDWDYPHDWIWVESYPFVIATIAAWTPVEYRCGEATFVDCFEKPQLWTKNPSGKPMDFPSVLGNMKASTGETNMNGGPPKIANLVPKTLLVGGLEHFLFSHILGIIIPID